MRLKLKLSSVVPTDDLTKLPPSRWRALVNAFSEKLGGYEFLFIVVLKFLMVMLKTQGDVILSACFMYSEITFLFIYVIHD